MSNTAHTAYSRVVRRIDNKHVVYTQDGEGPFLAKRLENGFLQDIPDAEPVILFRGRDKLAVEMLEFYRGLCVSDGCTDFQLTSMDDMIQKFKEFSQHSQTMKQPGVTRGL